MSPNLSALDFASVTPKEFAQLVRSAGKQELAELMAGPGRERVLDEVFTRMERQFRPDVGAQLDATVRWQITGGVGGASSTYELTMAGGRCTSTKGRTDAEPRATMTMGGPDFLKLVSGNASGPMLFMTRKLSADGDLGLAASLTRYFDIPSA